MKPTSKKPLSNTLKTDASKKTSDLLKKLEEKKYQDNHLKELERKRFQESKLRLKDFVVNMPLGQTLSEEEQVEMNRLLRYYKHRFITFCAILKEALTARRTKGPQMVKKPAVGLKRTDSTLEE